MRLDSCVIVVTGASSGLGRAMADTFVEDGASVVYSSNEDDRLAAAVDAITKETPAGEATVIPADVRSWDAVQRLIRETAERFRDIDVLVNNAGVTQPKVNPDHEWRSVPDVLVSTWDAVVETNLRGAFLCSKTVLPGMLSRGAGRLIHVSSGHGSRGRADRTPYVASKFGLEGFHESLAFELAGSGVDSIALRPPEGGVYTESWGRIGQRPDEFGHESPDVIAEAAVRLAAGEGENGGRYQATPDGKGYVEYTRDEE